MPEQEYVTARELKQFLKLEQLRNKATRNATGRAKFDQDRALRQHNAEDVLAAVEFIEAHAADRTDVHFPAAIVAELKTALPELGPAGENAEPMAAVLDRMQVAVSDEAGVEAMRDPAACASTAFQGHQRYSQKKRATAERQRGTRHRS